MFEQTDLMLNTESVPQTVLTNPSKRRIYRCKISIGDVQATSPSPCWMTLTKDFACLQCKYHPTWRKSLCPLNPMGVVAHHLYCDHRNFDSVNLGPAVQRWVSANPGLKFNLLF